MTNFTVDWFSNNIPHWQIHLAKFKTYKHLGVLEIGVFEGMATKWLLENICPHNTQYIAIDPFVDFDGFNAGKAENFRKNIGRDPRVMLVTETSRVALRRYGDETKDIIYIDGSHHSREVMYDSVICFDLLRVGGVMIFDDYLWDMKLPEVEKPKIAIDLFLDMYRGKYKLLHQGYQVIIEKIENC